MTTKTYHFFKQFSTQNLQLEYFPFSAILPVAKLFLLQLLKNMLLLSKENNFSYIVLKNITILVLISISLCTLLIHKNIFLLQLSHALRCSFFLCSKTNFKLFACFDTTNDDEVCMVPHSQDHLSNQFSSPKCTLSHIHVGYGLWFLRYKFKLQCNKWK